MYFKVVTSRLYVVFTIFFCVLLYSSEPSLAVAALLQISNQLYYRYERLRYPGGRVKTKCSSLCTNRALRIYIKNPYLKKLPLLSSYYNEDNSNNPKILLLRVRIDMRTTASNLNHLTTMLKRGTGLKKVYVYFNKTNLFLSIADYSHRKKTQPPAPTPPSPLSSLQTQSSLFGAACKTSKLALRLVNTNAAPTSPNVLGTGALIDDPESVIR